MAGSTIQQVGVGRAHEKSRDQEDRGTRRTGPRRGRTRRDSVTADGTPVRLIQKGLRG